MSAASDCSLDDTSWQQTFMSAIGQQHDLDGSALGPPRFSLRTLLAGMSALCVLFALMAAVGTIWSLVLAFFLSLVLAHVLGNSLGTKLCSRQALPAGNLPSVGVSVEHARPSRLALRTGLHRATTYMTLGGSLLCGVFGGAGLAAISPGASAGAVVLGICSSAVLGGFLGFTASSFFSVARAAIREALADPTLRQPVAHPPIRSLSLAIKGPS